jgi:hypothetical protein
MYQMFLILVLSLVTIAKAQSPHVFSLDSSPFTTTRASGNITTLTVNEFPILNRLSIQHIVLAPFGIREPHWYANANALGYCLVSFYKLFYFNKKKTFFFLKGWNGSYHNIW